MSIRVLVESRVTKVQIQKRVREEILCIHLFFCLPDFCYSLPSSEPMRCYWEGESGKCNSQGVSHLQWRRKREEGTARNLTFDRQMILLVVGRVDVLFILDIVLLQLWTCAGLKFMQRLCSEHKRLQ